MSIRTISESLFERFCGETGIRFTSIPTEPGAGRRTPDYEIHLQRPPILAEVKQIDPNPDDETLRRQLQETRDYEFQGVLGKRLRGKISEAASQLKARARTGQPALLIVYNNVAAHCSFTDPRHMMSAMYGLPEVVFTTSLGPAGPSLSISRRLGGSRGLTPEHNTTLSAVAVLFKRQEGPYLVVYHSRFASNPISSEVLRHPRILQRSIREIGPGKFPEWTEA